MGQLEFLSGNLKTRNFFFPIKMHPFVSSLFFLGNLRKKILLPPGFELQTFLSTVLYLCLKTTKSSYEIWVKVVFMNWSNNEHRKGCILMGKFFFQVFKLRDKNSRVKRILVVKRGEASLKIKFFCRLGCFYDCCQNAFRQKALV